MMPSVCQGVQNYLRDLLLISGSSCWGQGVLSQPACSSQPKLDACDMLSKARGRFVTSRHNMSRARGEYIACFQLWSSVRTAFLDTLDLAYFLPSSIVTAPHVC